jgi:hypothetical protein
MISMVAGVCGAMGMKKGLGFIVLAFIRLAFLANAGMIDRCTVFQYPLVQL